MSSLNGLLNINKPSGRTSRDAINVIQKLVRPTKVGHTGTLDPLANGVLVVTLGKATRLTEYVQQMAKTYRATFHFGLKSDTEDIEGNVETVDGPTIERSAVEAVLPSFTGVIQQRPPAFSALKVNGKRAYDLARAGEDVQLAERPIKIHRIEIVNFDFPRLVLDIECGSGTYIRSLGRDIAESLGTNAVMESLTRTAVGRFEISDAIDVESVSRENIHDSLIDMVSALDGLERLRLTEIERERISNGQIIQQNDLYMDEAVHEVAALAPNGKLAAILVKRKGGFGPKRNFM